MIVKYFCRIRKGCPYNKFKMLNLKVSSLLIIPLVLEMQRAKRQTRPLKAMIRCGLNRGDGTSRETK